MLRLIRLTRYFYEMLQMFSKHTMTRMACYKIDLPVFFMYCLNKLVTLVHLFSLTFSEKDKSKRIGGQSFAKCQTFQQFKESKRPPNPPPPIHPPKLLFVKLGWLGEGGGRKSILPILKLPPGNGKIGESRIR